MRAEQRGQTGCIAAFSAAEFRHRLLVAWGSMLGAYSVA